LDALRSADCLFSSVDAITETGDIVISDMSGSRTGGVASTVIPKVVFTIGANKIVPTLADVWDRLDQYVVPLEGARMRRSGGKGTSCNNIVTVRGSMRPDRFHIIIIKGHSLGF